MSADPAATGRLRSRASAPSHGAPGRSRSSSGVHPSPPGKPIQTARVPVRRSDSRTLGARVAFTRKCRNSPSFRGTSNSGDRGIHLLQQTAQPGRIAFRGPRAAPTPPASQSDEAEKAAAPGQELPTSDRCARAACAPPTRLTDGILGSCITAEERRTPSRRRRRPEPAHQSGQGANRTCGLQEAGIRYAVPR